MGATFPAERGSLLQAADTKEALGNAPCTDAGAVGAPSGCAGAAAAGVDKDNAEDSDEAAADEEPVESGGATASTTPTVTVRSGGATALPTPTVTVRSGGATALPTPTAT